MTVICIDRLITPSQGQCVVVDGSIWGISASPKNGLEMPPAPPGRPPPVRIGAYPAGARWPAFTLVPRCRRCAGGRHKPGGRSLLPRMACWRMA